MTVYLVIGITSPFLLIIAYQFYSKEIVYQTNQTTTKLVWLVCMHVYACFTHMHLIFWHINVSFGYTNYHAKFDENRIRNGLELSI